MTFFGLFTLAICIFLSGAIVLPVSSTSGRLCAVKREGKKERKKEKSEGGPVAVASDAGGILKGGSDHMVDVSNANPSLAEE